MWDLCLLALWLRTDPSPPRVRHASALADDGDPDNGSTISQSVAMAIAGSPLPHSKANHFALPSVVSGTQHSFLRAVNAHV